MRINHNIPALQSYHSIRNANKATAASMMRLTTGYKINSAKDDASGLAISNKIRMQLSGIDKANNNAMDGISLVQTADGALQEVHNILQRMRELAIQASTDTLENDDRDKIQEEIDQLLEEIDGISDRTEFNTKKLFGPKASGGKGFTFFNTDNTLSNLTKGISATEGFPDGVFNFEITKLGTPSMNNLDLSTVTEYEGKTITIEGKTIVFGENDNEESALSKIRNLAEEMGYEVRSLDPGVLSIYSQGELPIDTSLDLTVDYIDGEDAQIDNATFTLAGGAEIPIKSVEYIDNQIIFHLAEPYAGHKSSIEINISINSDGEYSFNGTAYDDLDMDSDFVLDDEISLYATYIDYSKVVLQIGPNQDQEMYVEIPQINAKTLGLTNMSYLLLNDAQKAINVCDSAIAEVSRVRSRLGAYQNRLEYTVSSLDSTSTATAESLSRIIDTDMAREMTNYTTQNLLSQAGISILSQANQRPQQILQLVGQ